MKKPKEQPASVIQAAVADMGVTVVSEDLTETEAGQKLVVVMEHGGEEYTRTFERTTVDGPINPASLVNSIVANMAFRIAKKEA